MKNTGMNNKGPERKERRAAVLVCAFLSVLLLACLLTGVAAAADSEGSEGAAEPVNPKVIEFASDGGIVPVVPMSIIQKKWEHYLSREESIQSS